MTDTPPPQTVDNSAQFFFQTVTLYLHHRAVLRVLVACLCSWAQFCRMPCDHCVTHTEMMRFTEALVYSTVVYSTSWQPCLTLWSLWFTLSQCGFFHSESVSTCPEPAFCLSCGQSVLTSAGTTVKRCRGEKVFCCCRHEIWSFRMFSGAVLSLLPSPWV